MKFVHGQWWVLAAEPVRRVALLFGVWGPLRSRGSWAAAGLVLALTAGFSLCSCPGSPSSPGLVPIGVGLGRSLAWLQADDGLGVLLVSAPFWGDGSVGRIDAYGVDDGNSLWCLEGLPGQHMGRHVSSFGDHNVDGVEDVLVSIQCEGPDQAIVCCGRTGASLGPIVYGESSASLSGLGLVDAVVEGERYGFPYIVLGHRDGGGTRRVVVCGRRNISSMEFVVLAEWQAAPGERVVGSPLVFQAGEELCLLLQRNVGPDVVTFARSVSGAEYLIEAPLGVVASSAAAFVDEAHGQPCWPGFGRGCLVQVGRRFSASSIAPLFRDDLGVNCLWISSVESGDVVFQVDLPFESVCASIVLDSRRGLALCSFPEEASGRVAVVDFNSKDAPRVLRPPFDIADFDLGVERANFGQSVVLEAMPRAGAPKAPYAFISAPLDPRQLASDGWVEPGIWMLSGGESWSIDLWVPGTPFGAY